MNDKMMKMLMKKKKEGKNLSDSDKEAKMKAIHGMRDMANEMLGSKVKGLKKVSVASNTEEGLKHGIGEAQKMLNQNDENVNNGDPNAEPEGMPEEMKSEPEHDDSDEGESPEDAEIMTAEDCKSPEDVDRLMEKLQAKKEEMLKNS